MGRCRCAGCGVRTRRDCRLWWRRSYKVHPASPRQICGMVHHLCLGLMLTMFRAFMEGAFEYVSSWEVLSSNNTPKKRETKTKREKGVPVFLIYVRFAGHVSVPCATAARLPRCLACQLTLPCLPAYSALLASFTLPCLSADAPEQQRYR